MLINKINRLIMLKMEIKNYKDDLKGKFIKNHKFKK